MANDRLNQIIDLREGFSYAGEFAPGSTHRLYDIFNAGILGDVGDTLMWQTPHGDVQGDVTATGWEDRPLPTRWVDVVVSRG